MIHNQLKGTGVALVTPFNNNEIDFEALERVINHCIDDGVEFLVSLGTTGESATLSQKEKHDVLNHTIKTIDKRVPLVAGFGGNDTHKILKDMEAFHFDGIDAILSSSPAYNKPTQEGLFQHYKLLAENAPKPIIIYNVPSRTSSNIDANTTLRLAHTSKNIIGIKEAAYDMGQISKIIKHKPKNFVVLSGDDTLALPLVSVGGDGVISVIANAFPSSFSRMIRLGLQQNFREASKIHLKLTDVHPWLYKEGNPAGIKACMELLRLCRSETRLPLVPASEELVDELKKELVRINAIVPDDAIV